MLLSALLGLNLLLLLIVLSLFEELRLCVSVFGLDFVKIGVLRRHFDSLLIGRILRVTVSFGRVYDLAVGAAARLVPMIVKGLPLLMQRRLLIRIPWAPIHGARVLLVVTLLSLVALKVRILARTDLVLLRVRQYCLLRHFLRIHVHVLLALLELFRGLRVQVVHFVGYHIIIILLNLLIAHNLIQLHLTV